MKKQNYKPHTATLTTDEKLLLPYLEKALLRTNKTKPKFNDELTDELNKVVERIKETGIDIPKINGARLRKMINHMRCNSILPIISTSKGYYVSYEIEDMCAMILSLRMRAEAIEAAADGLAYIVQQKKLTEKIDEDFFTELDKKK
jgi:hypothetical protein